VSCRCQRGVGVCFDRIERVFRCKFEMEPEGIDVYEFCLYMMRYADMISIRDVGNRDTLFAIFLFISCAAYTGVYFATSFVGAISGSLN
jgi:hypothetical protein